MEDSSPQPESQSDQAFKQAEELGRLAKQTAERADDLEAQGHGDSGRAADAQEYAAAGESAQIRGAHAKKAELDLADTAAKLSHDLPIDPETAAILKPMIEHLALVRAINEAWLLMAALTAVALLFLPFAGRAANRMAPDA